MAGYRSIAGSGSGNLFIDALAWGGQVWDMTNEPILVYWGGSGATEYQAAEGVHGPSVTMDGSSIRSSWDNAGVQATIYVMNLYSSVANIRFGQATSVSDADIVWWWMESAESFSGAHEVPDGGARFDQRWGFFNTRYSEAWLEKGFGSIGLKIMIHEIGHGLGLAHPHDGGTRNDATRFPNVNTSGDLGDNNLNQSVYTVMSYMPGLYTAPGDGRSYGEQGGLGAFDIAAIQAIYGANMATATGNDTYTLPTKNERGTGWMSIWDAGGTDTISAAGSSSGVTIDLRPATLRPGDPGAGGYISQQAGIAGGFTIAGGVVIENAVGSPYGDFLVGNLANNILNGGAGDDTYYIYSPGTVIVDTSGYDTVYATFNFSHPAIENIYVNGVQTKATDEFISEDPIPFDDFNLLRGGKSKDVLVGLDGVNDKIYGGGGKDVLTGGAGQDFFVFDTKPNSRTNVDTITDFSSADDTIWLDNKVFKKLGKGSASKPGALKKAFFKVADKAKDKDDYLVYNRKKGILYYDEDGSGAKAAIAIAKLANKASLTKNNFFVI